MEIDVFESFKDEEGKFKVKISNDVQGLLSLYEASYLSFEGETVWEAKAFSRTHLMNLMKEGIESTEVAEQLSETRCIRRYFDIYNKKEQHNPSLLELAKLDFNMVQSLYQKELQELSRWWEDIGIGSKLNHFARDRYVESFFWSVGMIPEPEFTSCRQELTKAVQLITIHNVDDVYDTYGTLAELELFTEAFERWDVDVINTLPDDMILCFLAVYNTVNELDYNIFKEGGIK
ncbi:LOW QUALITY PROTEIN: hypothetical protein GLYMA_13G304700v4 [Glycine max]|uniref:Terpene synthase metal-binding domain-containing protein n=1 Tax=Glycine max TaxID=3847 RepID=A0A0R0H610_SOYBN|nr:LOW QUALITY PROTEIN: hypothetical protein GLYMA_13G304700v4 [Glycine max]